MKKLKEIIGLIVNEKLKNLYEINNKKEKLIYLFQKI
jgi:hypothetical protein